MHNESHNFLNINSDKGTQQSKVPSSVQRKGAIRVSDSIDTGQSHDQYISGFVLSSRDAINYADHMVHGCLILTVSLQSNKFISGRFCNLLVKQL